MSVPKKRTLLTLFASKESTVIPLAMGVYRPGPRKRRLALKTNGTSTTRSLFSLWPALRFITNGTAHLRARLAVRRPLRLNQTHGYTRVACAPCVRMRPETASERQRRMTLATILTALAQLRN